MNFSLQIRSYKKQNKTQAIRLRFSTTQNDIQYLDTKVSVLKSQWDNKKQIVKKHPLEENLNAQLQSLLIDVKGVYYNNIGASAKRLLQVYKNHKKYGAKSFLDFYQSIVDEMTLKEKINTAKANQQILNKLKKYSPRISFSDLSVEFAKEYEIWMLKRKNKTNTIATNFKAIYATLNKAVNLGLIESNTLRGHKITTENIEKQSLTYDEVLKMVNLEIIPKNKGMIKARDMFLFSFFSAGMRFSDVCKLKWDNITNGNIVYTMSKSRTRAGAKRTIPLNPKSENILNQYKGRDKVFVFPALYGYQKAEVKNIEHKIFLENNNLNRALKLIAKEMGFNINLSMHISKHSFTDFAVKNDVDLLIISKLLGHTKLSTTQHYLKDFYQKEEAETISKLFE